MKVMLLSSYLPRPHVPGNVPFISSRIKALIKKNIDVRSFLVSNTSEVDYNFKDIGLFEHQVKVMNFYFEDCWEDKNKILDLIESLKDQYYKSGCDIIHAHAAFPAGYIASLLKDKYNISYVLTIHGSDIHTTPFEDKQFSRQVKELTIKALKKAECVISVSDFLIKKAFLLTDKIKRFEIIPNGIDSMFKNSTKKNKKEEVVLGFIGNLISVKGADRVLPVFRKVKEYANETKLIIIGDGDLKEKISNDIEEKEKEDILLTGRIPHNEIPIILSKIDILFLPSRNEGWPCIINEALATKTPVIGVDNGGIREAIGDSKYVVYADEHIIDRLSQKIIEVIKNGYNEELYLKAQNMTWDVIIQKEIDIYRMFL